MCWLVLMIVFALQGFFLLAALCTSWLTSWTIVYKLAELLWITTCYCELLCCVLTIQQCVYMCCLCFVIQLPPVLPHVFGIYKEVTGVSVLPPHYVFHQPVSGVTNKDCIQAECLSSSRKMQEHIPTFPPSNTVSYSSLPIGPVHEWTPMNNCCHPLRLNDSCSHC